MCYRRSLAISCLRMLYGEKQAALLVDVAKGVSMVASTSTADWECSICTVFMSSVPASCCCS